MIKRFGWVLLFTLAAGLPVAAGAADAPAKTPYPLQTCIVSGEHLTAGEMVVYTHHEEGQPDRVMKFCCRKCLAKFKADPAKYLKELDAAVAKSAKKN